MATATAPKATGRLHKATYARDKKQGGYLIRVAGPYPEQFAGRSVPVTLKNGEEHDEDLTALIWTGVDKESGDKVALYKFASKPREEQEQAAF